MALFAQPDVAVQREGCAVGFGQLCCEKVQNTAKKGHVMLHHPEPALRRFQMIRLRSVIRWPWVAFATFGCCVLFREFGP